MKTLHYFKHETVMIIFEIRKIHRDLSMECGLERGRLLVRRPLGVDRSSPGKW